MKTFKEFLSQVLNEDSMDLPQVKFPNMKIRFTYTTDIYAGDYNPDLDRGERSDSGIVGAEPRDSTYFGDVIVPLKASAVLESKKRNLGVQDFLLSFKDGAQAVKHLDIDSAIFAARGGFRPPLTTDSIPDEAYESLAYEAALAIDNDNFEVLNV